MPTNPTPSPRTRKQAEKKKGKVKPAPLSLHRTYPNRKAACFVLDLGPVPTLAERCVRLATRLRTATRQGVVPQPLSMNECLQAARLLDLYSKTHRAMHSHRL